MAIIDADCSCKLLMAVCSLLNLHTKCALSMMNKEILCPKMVTSPMDDMDDLASTLSFMWCMIQVYSAVQSSTRAWVRESVQQWQIDSRYLRCPWPIRSDGAAHENPSCKHPPTIGNVSYASWHKGICWMCCVWEIAQFRMSIGCVGWLDRR